MDTVRLLDKLPNGCDTRPPYVSKSLFVFFKTVRLPKRKSQRVT